MYFYLKKTRGQITGAVYQTKISKVSKIQFPKFWSEFSQIRQSHSIISQIIYHDWHFTCLKLK